MAAVPQLNLPIAQDQQVLAQAFAQGVAAQASPVSSAPPGTTFISSAETAPLQPQRSAAPGPSSLGASAFASAPAGAPTATIAFAHGGSALGGDDLEAIRQVAQAASAGAVVRVVGHASQRTRNMSMERHRLANFNVSFERAQSVAGALRRAGVDPRRILVEAVGDSQPRYYEFMPSGEAENRRVEIFLE
jgi:outer membrane protein OmpA-like peptidoglycan-associated protein